MDRLSDHISLHEEILASHSHPEIFGRIAFVGKRRSGRKTLATRLRDIDKEHLGPIIQPLVFVDIKIDLSTVYETSQEEATFRIYILPQNFLDKGQVSFWYDTISVVQLVVFCFDVNDHSSLQRVLLSLDMFRTVMERERQPPYIMVGNKTDLRNNQNPGGITTTYGALKAAERGADYYECSAKQNLFTRPISDLCLWHVIENSGRREAWPRSDENSNVDEVSR